MSKVANKSLVLVAGAVAALALPRAALAHGAVEEGTQKDPTAADGASLGKVEANPSEDRPATEEARDEEEKKLELGIDWVMGFGKTPVVTSVLPGTLATVPTNEVSTSQIMSHSFIVGGMYNVTKTFGVGVRLPFALGTFSPPQRQTRSTTALGALELEGEYELQLNRQTELEFALGVALPTAQGDEVPSQADLQNQTGPIDQNNYDRFSLNRAAASSRGFEENALFEPKRLGIIPKVGLNYEVNKVMIQPYVKLENLISTVNGAANGYLGELVFGGYLGYHLHEHVDAGVRVWGNVPLNGDGSSVGVVEPQLRGHFGSLMPVLGGILPFAGPLTDPYFAGIRLALAGEW